MAFQRTRRPSLRSGRSGRSLGSPLNAYPLGALAVLMIAASFATTSCASSGPQTRGSVSGLVVDDHGLQLPGTAVTLRSRRGMAVGAVATSRDGSYGFQDLPGGDYWLTMELAGFSPSESLIFRLKPGTDQRMQVVVLRPDRATAALGPAAFQSAQVAVIRALMDLAKESPPYYLLAIIDGADYRPPPDSLQDAVASLTVVPVMSYQLGTTGGVLVGVMAQPDARAASLVLLRGTASMQGGQWWFRFHLAPEGASWRVSDFIRIGKIDAPY